MLPGWSLPRSAWHLDNKRSEKYLYKEKRSWSNKWRVLNKKQKENKEQQKTTNKTKDNEQNMAKSG